MAGTGGKRQGAGRKKGVPNKVTKDLKEMILGALNAKGGQAYLEKVAADDLKAFCSLLGKIIPTTIAGDPENPVQIAGAVDRPPEETREQWLARRTRELGIGAVVGAAARPPNGRDHS